MQHLWKTIHIQMEHGEALKAWLHQEIAKHGQQPQAAEPEHRAPK